MYTQNGSGDVRARFGCDGRAAAHTDFFVVNHECSKVRLAQGRFFWPIAHGAVPIKSDAKFCEYCGTKLNVIGEDLGKLILSNTKAIRQALSAGGSPVQDVSAKETVDGGVDSDIQMLLEKCKQDPANRRRYANLILDIDPTNREAAAYLR